MTDILFSSLKIRGIEIRNRICIPAMVFYGHTDDSGNVTERHIEHYSELAKGIPGLIIQEATCVEKAGRMNKTQLGIWNDEHISGLRRIVDAVHTYDIPIILQLHHAGITAMTSYPAGTAEEYEYRIGPSDYICKYKYSTFSGRAMTCAEIKQMKKCFSDAALRAVKAGYDGVEIHGCHNYLLSQFFNRNINQRKDIYGNPTQFPIEVFRVIREVVPSDFIVGMRLGGFQPELTDGIYDARIMDANGIDFLNISYGFRLEQKIELPEYIPYTDLIYAAQRIKQSVYCPVFCVGGIKSPAQARRILKDTSVDMVAIGRGVLVNPRWPDDAENKRPVGKCLDCAACYWRGHRSDCPGRKLLYDSRLNEATTE